MSAPPVSRFDCVRLLHERTDLFMNPVVKNILKGILTAATVFANVLAIQYTMALLRSRTFTPDWISLIAVSIFSGALTVVGPNAEERKRNRENLMKKFKR